MTDFAEIDRMTLWEYQLRMKACNLRMVDEEYRIAKTAWMNQQAGAMKKKGKNGREPYFKTFKDFFDYAAQEERVLYGNKSASKTGRAQTTMERYREYMRSRKK